MKERALEKVVEWKLDESNVAFVRIDEKPRLLCYFFSTLSCDRINTIIKLLLSLPINKSIFHFRVVQVNNVECKRGGKELVLNGFVYSVEFQHKLKRLKEKIRIWIESNDQRNAFSVATKWMQNRNRRFKITRNTLVGCGSELASGSNKPIK